jgi:hypothetical protein
MGTGCAPSSSTICTVVGEGCTRIFKPRRSSGLKIERRP